MVYRRPPSRFGVNSLSMKLSLLISAICLIAGICAAALMLKSEEKQLVFEEHELLKHSSERLSRQFNGLIKTKTNILRKKIFITDLGANIRIYLKEKIF